MRYVLIFLGIILIFSGTFGQTDEYPHVMDNGGGKVSDGTHENLASIGQAVAGIASDGTNTNQAGYITAVSFVLDIGEESHSKGLSSNMEVYGNYPNPFQEKTRIEFVLPRESEVSFSVFDISGEKLVTESQRKFPAGRHRINFEAPNLPSGIYIYRLKTEDTEKIRKMVITN